MSVRAVEKCRDLAAAVGLAFLSVPAYGQKDLTTLSLEELLDVKVTTASKYGQKVSEAPSSVTVITADDIRDHGHRTLADILRSVRGFYVTYDRQYDYIGTRGFGRPGDYNSRVVVLVDGYRTNDNIYNTGYIGHDMVLDVDLIERVEIVRGPSSSVYGGNAFFGVINIITRKGSDVAGTQLAGAVGSYGWKEGRATLGKRLDNGADLLLSASGLGYRGTSLSFPEPELDTPEMNSGRSDAGRDYTRTARVFAKWSLDNWQIEAAQAGRDKGNATGFGGVVLNEPSNHFTDTQGFLNLKYRARTGEGGEWSARTYYGWYDYWANNAYVDALGDPYAERDLGSGRWWGAEANRVFALSPRHKLNLGIQYEDNLRQRQRNFDVQTGQMYLDDHRTSQLWGVQIQDDFQLTPAIALSAGLRGDKYSHVKTEWSPRLGLIYSPAGHGVWKLLYGTAFRPPSVYESYYSYPGFSIANPSLRPEKIRTYELVHERFLTPQTRITASAYTYRTKHLIDTAAEFDGTQNVAQFQNISSVTGRGADIELQHQWRNGARLRTSATSQITRADNGMVLSNSPRTMFKANFSVPVLDTWRSGFELQAMSRRITRDGNGVAGETGGHAVVNLTLLRPMTKQGIEFSASVYNVFDRRYEDPVQPDSTVPSRSVIVQDGRSLRLKAQYTF